MAHPVQMTRPHRLGVIVVSYNVRALLRQTLHSVYASVARSPGELEVHVIVVDNASGDGSARMVAEEFPQVELLAAPANLGFAGANNLALRRLLGEKRPVPENPALGSDAAGSTSFAGSPDFLLLLNPDTELEGKSLGAMVRFLAATPAAGVCGASLCYGDGRFQHGAFHFPTLAQVVIDLWPLAVVPGLRRYLSWLEESRWNGRYPYHLWDGDAPFAVDFVLGAALMVRTAAVRQIGLLDEGYFMYCEEMDWCLRCRQAGWSIYAVPEARIVHHEGQSSRQTPWLSFIHLWRSRHRFYRRHRSRYSPLFLSLHRALLLIGIYWRSWLARHRFAHGRLAGDVLGDELDAYRTVLSFVNEGSSQ